MKKISKPIVFFGTEEFSARSLRALIDAGFNVAAVVTKPDSPKGRGKKLSAPIVKEIALESNVPVWQPEKIVEIREKITKLDTPVGVLVSYGKLITQDILGLFTPGIINIHPSLLPKYRGPSPIESAILNGERETGVSIMQLTNEVDAGSVYSQIKISLNGDEYTDDLYKTLAQKGSKLLVNTLPSILNGQLQPAPQNENEVSHSKLIAKNDGIIDWNKPAIQIEREVRAFHVWPKSSTGLGEVEVIITKAHVVPGDDTPGKIEVDVDANLMMIYCGEGYLCVDRLQPIGKKEMPVQAFLSGYKDRLAIS